MARDSVVSRIAHDSCLTLPRMMPDRKWWERLPEAFATSPEQFDLVFRDRWRVKSTAITDVWVRTLAASAVGALAMPLGYHPRALASAIDDLELYRPAAESANPDRFFARPRPGVAVRAKHLRVTSLGVRNGERLDLRFDSPFVPVNPRHRRRWRRHKRNAVCHARYWRHHDGPRPTLIVVHGFGAETYRLNEWFFELPTLFAMGYDLLLFVLPFHGPRQARSSPFSGHGFFSGGVTAINEAFAQAVCDLRVLIDHLQTVRGVDRVGITGISLGGYTTALMAAVEPRLHCAIPNVPVVSLADLVLEWQPIGAAVRALLGGMGRSVREVRELLACACPLSYASRLPRERLMIIGGVGDRLAPPKHARLLWDHWGRCRLHWFPGSHLIHLDKGDYVREMASFFKEVGF